MFFKNIAYFVMALFVSPCIGTELTVVAPLPVIATTCEVTDVTSTSAVTAKNKIGNAKVPFNVDSLKKTLIVKVK